jgi:hypothetical protein
MNKHIKIPIPDWVPNEYDVKYWWSTLKYKFHPFRCDRCKTKMKFKYPDYEGVAGKNNERLIVSNTKGSLCASCLSVSIELYFNSLPNTKKYYNQCQCCNTHSKSVDIIWGLGENTTNDIDVRFCTRWWNGHYVCYYCIRDTLAQDRQTSSMHVYHRGETYYLNERGALIKHESKNVKVT